MMVADKRIFYVKSYHVYKYKLIRPFHCIVQILGYNRCNAFIQLQSSGDLFISAGYAWDGPSGPTVDTPSFMRGSLVHDALYQLMREGLISSTYREYADDLLREIVLQDGMLPLRAKWVHWAVRKFGKFCIRLEENKCRAYCAPPMQDGRTSVIIDREKI